MDNIDKEALILILSENSLGRADSIPKGKKENAKHD